MKLEIGRYAEKDTLNGDEALAYIQLLTKRDWHGDEFVYYVEAGEIPAYIYSDYATYPCYGGEYNGLPIYAQPLGLQKILSDDWIWLNWRNGKGFFFQFPDIDDLINRDNEIFIDLRGSLIIEHEEKKGLTQHDYVDWRLKVTAIIGDDVKPLFLPNEVQALANKINHQKNKGWGCESHAQSEMNPEPNQQSPQEENQYLQQEVETLRAELEQLKAENAELKAKPLSNHGLEFTQNTKWLKIISEVQKRFYHPDRFCINEPDSRPPKEDITGWIIKNHGINKTNADIVERVATPFDRSRAKKKQH